MKKYVFLLFVTTFILEFYARADEGMWLPLLIKQYNIQKMQEMGCKLSAEDIYDINNSSLKDAIAGLANAESPFGFFCSGEMISPEGLLLTNHHCGYESIQEHSSVQSNYLTNGFWALSHEEEMPNENMTVSFLVRMEDVTDKVLRVLSDTMEAESRQDAIENISDKLIKEATAGTGYEGDVKSMLEGNKYYLLVYETYLDVRLVGAPPSSIGKFGGDTDNWMWPRHTGDFSLLRVYMGKDGKPAKYSPDNIPYKPKHFLPVSLKGVDKGDFSMVMGFPGSTQRYLPSYGVQEKIDVTDPATVKIRTKKLELMKEDMNSDKKTAIQYAAKYAETSNYWKYFIGEMKGLKKLKIVDKKKAIEDELEKWIQADNDRVKRYGPVLGIIKDGYAGSKTSSLVNTYMEEALLQGGEVILFPLQALQLFSVLNTVPDNKELVTQFAEPLKAEGEKFFKDYNPVTDKKIFAALLKMYSEDIPELFQADIIALIKKKYKGDVDRFADAVFEKSVFSDKDRFMKFVENPDFKTLDKDLAFKTMVSVMQMFFTLESVMADTRQNLETGNRLFVAALMEMNQNESFYPDANSTLRLSYGTVGDYKPADGVHYNYYTTLKGIIEKEDSTNEEFVVPEKLKKLYLSKDFGRYAQNGEMRVCFTTNNDITGGNSGSPVINGKGELIGTAFDGNWEAMSGDVAYEPQLQKCINVDIRYVLFIIDKFAGAKNLIDEMTIVE